MEKTYHAIRAESAADYPLLSELTIKQLGGEKAGIVVFGMQGMGIVIKNALSASSISVACFCDNSPPDSGMCHGLRCLDPPSAVLKHPDAVYVLCAMEPSTCYDMKDQLTSILPGVRYCYWDVLYYGYATSLRNVDRMAFAEALWCFWGEKNSKDVLIHSLSLRITSRCTLRCKECCFLVPYQPDQRDFPLKELVNPMKRLCQITDGILDLTINGGETLLYSDLDKLINEVACLSNIIGIVIVTNGTVIPSNEILKLCADNAIRVRISNYGGHSSRSEELYEKCRVFGVAASDYRHSEKWCALGVKKHNRSNEENRIIADNCPPTGGKRRRALGLYNGGVHICDRYDGLAACGHIDDELFSDLHFDVETGDKAALRGFLVGGTHYRLCDMCNWPMHEIPPGEQL